MMRVVRSNYQLMEEQKMKKRRCNNKIITDHSRVLKFMRVSRSFSMRKAGRIVGTSSSTVNHIENGRMDISDNWVRKFVEGYGYTLSDYDAYIAGKKAVPLDYRDECINIIRNMDNPKLKAVHGFLSNV